MSYIDGFVLVVPKQNIEAYTALAQKAGAIWKDHGALAYMESVLEDEEDKGFCLNFQKTLELKEDETAVFAYIVYPSREERDAINAKVMADPRLSCGDPEMSFDPKRMTYGGFKAIVEF